MDYIIPFIYQHLDYAPWIIFGALMLAGISIPISEDVMLITAGVLAGTVMPEHRLQLFLFSFAGCYFSDWEAYWLGRILGRRILRIGWFKRVFRERRLEKTEHFYDKYGIYTLFFGRFIPFGVRNLLFITAGMGKMHFGRFILSDGLACLFSNALIFYLAYSCGKNYETLSKYLGIGHILIFITSLLSVVVIGIMYRKMRSLRKGTL
jgi:membrane-associated protein